MRVFFLALWQWLGYECTMHRFTSIDVGQWLVAGLQWSSSVRQSLAVRQKELSEWYRLILKRQKCIEIKLNPCNFLLFFTSFCSFFYFSFLFLYFLSFFPFFPHFSVFKCTTEMDCTTKWAFNWRPWRPASYVDGPTDGDSDGNCCMSVMMLTYWWWW